MSEGIEQLEAEHVALSGRVEAKRRELGATVAELGGIVGAIIDAGDNVAERSKLIKRRAELVALRDLAGDELRELTKRRDVAHVACYQHAVDQAQQVASDAQAESTRLRIAMNEAADSHLRLLNRGGRVPNTEEAARALVESEVTKARAAAEASIAHGAAQRAGHVRELAELALAEVVAGLGGG